MQTPLMFSSKCKMLQMHLSVPHGCSFCKLCSLQSLFHYCSLCCLPFTVHVKSNTPRSSSTIHPSRPRSERSALCCLVFYLSTPDTPFLHVLTLKRTAPCCGFVFHHSTPALPFLLAAGMRSCTMPPLIDRCLTQA